MKRREKANDKAAAAYATAADDDDFRGFYPGIFEHLTAKKWEDGKERITSTVVMFCEEGFFKICLSDRNTEEVAFMADDTWEGVLQALEQGIQGDSLDWRRKGGKRK